MFPSNIYNAAAISRLSIKAQHRKGVVCDESGFVGLGPQSMQPGDLVVVILGQAFLVF